MELLAWSVAVLAATGWVGVRAAGFLGQQRALEEFHLASAASIAPSAEAGSPATHPASLAPDTSLWDARRIHAHRQAVKDPGPPPLAILRIPRLKLEVAVLEGTDDWTLNRAVGHVEGTALPGEDGNLAIAGHRDGYFRILKDVALGEVIEVDRRGGRDVYRVTSRTIIRPAQVEVLDPTPKPALTLVTCYPFYFVGPSPQRFIVRAERVEGPSLAQAGR